jgi:hypothetical protein
LRSEMRSERPNSRSPGNARNVAGAVSEPDCALLASPDGLVAFKLEAKGSRLFVQRTQRRADQLVAVQCLLICNVDDFRRWCDVEPIRFEHPVVFDRLRRYGDEVFAHGE